MNRNQQWLADTASSPQKQRSVALLDISNSQTLGARELAADPGWAGKISTNADREAAAAASASAHLAARRAQWKDTTGTEMTSIAPETQRADVVHKVKRKKPAGGAR